MLKYNTLLVTRGMKSSSYLGNAGHRPFSDEISAKDITYAEYLEQYEPTFPK